MDSSSTITPGARVLVAVDDGTFLEVRIMEVSPSGKYVQIDSVPSPEGPRCPWVQRSVIVEVLDAAE